MGLRINHNLASLNASLNLGRANSLLSKSLARLSTGLKINNASDGPADLIISEKFRAQINSISKAMENTENAISMLSTAEGALTEVNSLLTKMKGLALKAVQSGTQDPEEIAASQAEIDSALASINSIARNTSFGTKFLLDGSLDIATAEVDSDNVSVQLERANFAGDSQRLSLDVQAAAQQASNVITLNSSGQLDSAQSLKVTGVRGSSTVTFASGAAGADIAKTINDQTTQTGVTATYDSTFQELTLKSIDYGESEFVTVSDVDGTSDILKGQLEEQATKAFLTYGGQFEIRAKEAGTAGELISFKLNETTTSAAPTSVAVTKDVNSGQVTVTMTLQDGGNLLFGAHSTGYTGDREMDKDITTTLNDIKTFIESNGTLNDLVDFKLLGSAKLSDTVTYDSNFTRDFVQLKGGASGDAATFATTTLQGTTSGNSLTFTAKTAGAGGNDISIIFGADGSALQAIALDSTGALLTTDTSYFSTSGTTQVYLAGNNTLIINDNATIQQIVNSIENDSTLSRLISVSTTGQISDTIRAADIGKSHSLTGGTGITGGRSAQAFIDFSSTTTEGIKVSSKLHGDAGNGVELVFRNRGATDKAGTVEVFTAQGGGSKVVYNLSVTGGTTAVYDNLFATASTNNHSAAAVGVSTVGIQAKYTGHFYNQFDFRLFSNESLDNNPVLSYDKTNKRINITVDFGTTLVSDLAGAIAQADSVIDDETGMTIADAFSIIAVGHINSVITGTGSAFGAGANDLNTSLVTGYFSIGVGSTANTSLGRYGIDGTDGNSAFGIIQKLRQNSTVRDLIDVDIFGSGSSVTLTTLEAVADNAVSTSVVGNTFDGAQQAWGDFRFVLTGGYNGEVTTNSVRKDGVNGQVKVNGIDTSANNLNFTFDTGDVRGTVKLQESFNTTGNSSSFTITSRGAFFQIGQKAQLSYQTGIALRDISTNSLGEGLYLNSSFDTSLAESTTNQRRVIGTLADITSGAKFDLSKDATTAVDIIENAITEISVLRGQVGAFITNTLESNINSLGVAFENLTAAESRIRDVDFAAETAEFTRAQILVQAGTSIAAQANVATQAALQLLG